MALIYRARLTPSKAELLASWMPSQPWSRDARAAPLELVGAYRFDDPAGEVGIETHLVRTASGDVVQVPLTYRGAPLDGAGDALVATMTHSQLGQRWVYDGCADPVYAAALAATIRTGGRQAELWVQTDDGLEPREVTTFVVGSGTPGTAPPVIDAVTTAHGPAATTIRTSGGELVVQRVIDPAARADGAETLTGSWPGHDAPALLAFIRV